MQRGVYHCRCEEFLVLPKGHLDPLILAIANEAREPSQIGGCQGCQAPKIQWPLHHRPVNLSLSTNEVLIPCLKELLPKFVNFFENLLWYINGRKCVNRLRK
jgi:hypothetical protein